MLDNIQETSVRDRDIKINPQGGTSAHIMSSVQSILSSENTNENIRLIDIFFKCFERAIHSFYISDDERSFVSKGFHISPRGCLDIEKILNMISIKNINSPTGKITWGYISWSLPNKNSSMPNFSIVINECLIGHVEFEYTLLHELIHGVHILLEWYRDPHRLRSIQTTPYMTYKTELFARMYTANWEIGDMKNWGTIWDNLGHTMNRQEVSAYNLGCEHSVIIMSSRNHIWNSLSKIYGNNGYLLKSDGQKIFGDFVRAIENTLFLLTSIEDTTRFVNILNKTVISTHAEPSAVIFYTLYRRLKEDGSSFFGDILDTLEKINIQNI